MTDDVADEGVVEDLPLEVVPRDVGDPDVERDGRASRRRDQAVEAGDEHETGDHAGDARPSRRRSRSGRARRGRPGRPPARTGGPAPWAGNPPGG